jgi:hypothetical protein
MLLVFVGLAVLVGGLVSQVIALPRPLALSPAAAVLILAFIMAVPFLLKNWRITLGILLVWLVVEDLFRKFAGNDLRIYLAKDFAFLILLLGLFLDPGFRERWREATGATRFILYTLVAWALIMSVPTAWQDWRIPLIGLRLDFMYAPLVVAGFALGSSRASLRRWLLIASAIAAAVSVIGIIQATIGPSFLAASRETPGLRGDLFRVVGNTLVYRPTATFVEPGRFAAFAVLGLAMSLAALTMTHGRRRMVAAVCAALNGGGVWVSGGRAGLVVGVALVLFAAMAGPLAEGRLAMTRAMTLVAVIAAALVVLAAAIPGVIGDRLEWYSETLDPRSPNSEWSYRIDAYVNSTRLGTEFGGMFGRGTGTESIGKQYLSGDPNSIEGRYLVEGGYASIAVEWGIFGLALWIAWSSSWVARQWAAINAARGHRSAAAGFILFGWMLFFLFLNFFGGLAGFQNYIANLYFWLLSGMIFALPLAANDTSGRGPIASRTSLIDVEA